MSTLALVALVKVVQSTLREYLTVNGPSKADTLGKIVALVDCDATCELLRAVEAVPALWVETRIVSMPSHVLLSPAYEFDGWECSRVEMHTAHGSFAVWPDRLGASSWSMCGGADGVAKIGHYSTQESARLDAEMYVESMSAAPVEQPATAPLSGWISVTERLPELGDYSVLVCWPANGGIDMVHVEDYFSEITAGLDADGKQLYSKWYLKSGIAHWMPLPAAPTIEASAV